MESAVRLPTGSSNGGGERAADDAAFIERLSEIVGQSHVLTGAERTRRFCTGFRFGHGAVVAVVRPGTLVEQWRVLQACVAANKIVIMQAANTGLTGGSTPDGNDYDRGIVLINTMRIAGIHLINEGKQVVCLPGAMLYQLENRLRPLGRDPHSVIGSSCIGASVFGGICNNSGGALIHRGPAFTQLTLFAQLD
ncbi:MAG TPA: FAD-binding protein, partial [Bradyrhizobium sp.]|nr:FAD-binding protein [Bradyrhizobium sp.]